MKKFLFSVVTVLGFVCTTYASSPGNETNSLPSTQTPKNFQEMVDYICKDIAFKCNYHVGVFTSAGIYVTGTVYSNYTTTEEDCCDLIDAAIQKYVDAGYTQENGYNVYDTTDR